MERVGCLVAGLHNQSVCVDVRLDLLSSENGQVAGVDAGAVDCTTG